MSFNGSLNRPELVCIAERGGLFWAVCFVIQVGELVLNPPAITKIRLVHVIANVCSYTDKVLVWNYVSWGIIWEVPHVSNPSHVCYPVAVLCYVSVSLWKFVTNSIVIMITSYLQFSQLANRMRSIPAQNRNNEIQICSSLVYLTNTTYIPSYPYRK